MDQPSMKGAWFQLWEKIPDSLLWRQIYMSEQLSALPHSQNAIQLELRCSTHPRALVARLDNDIPQVVSLPRMQTSVLVTSLRTLSGVLTPRVIVGSYSPNAEAIMEFLRAGRLGSVESMLDPGNELAHQLLWDKIIDPIAATAAAYYLLRKRDWDRLPSQWLDNLSFWNKDIPDAKLIHAASQIERGMPMAKACKLASETLSSFLENGIPLFAEASNLLSDLLALAEKAEEPLEVHTARVLRMMVASSHQSGLSFGFAGKSPNKPLPAHKAFESKKLRREFARQIVDLTEAKIVKPPSNKLNAKRSRRQMHVATKIMGPLLPSPQSTVSGNTAKTLFLQSILDEIAWVPR
ncbi:hypothetical protein IW00_02340 [Pectobacterium brasiliense]|nr:hypothetical protein IW00_02340 [Pectobacterium brasiliense]